MPRPVESAVDKLIQQGIELLEAGDMLAARELLSQAVVLEPQNEKAWLWRSGAVGSDAERRLCLQHVLTINPHNEVARQGIEHLAHPPVVAPVKRSQRRIKRLSIQPPPPVPVPAPPSIDPFEGMHEAARKSYSREMLYWPESHQRKRPVWVTVVLVVIILAVSAYTILRSLHMIDPIALPFAASGLFSFYTSTHY